MTMTKEQVIDMINTSEQLDEFDKADLIKTLNNTLQSMSYQEGINLLCLLSAELVKDKSEIRFLSTYLEWYNNGRASTQTKKSLTQVDVGVGAMRITVGDNDKCNVAFDTPVPGNSQEQLLFLFTDLGVTASWDSDSLLILN